MKYMNKYDYDFFPEWRNENYYFFLDDLRKYPDCWCYVVWSRRGSGKTYSALRSAYENGITIAYMKRTIEDVNIVCTNSDGFDLSPYVPINRDCGTHIKPKLIKKGIGGVYEDCDEKGNPIGAPISYILALNCMKKVKGIELSNCDWVLLDEFIPQAGEIIRQAEGEMLLDMYMTILRDRVKRGNDHTKLILFANSENISTPITNELEIIDDMIDLIASGQTHKEIKDRGIMLHFITNEEIPYTEEELQGGIFSAMRNTSWGNKAFGGEFVHNDFTNIGRDRMKNYIPLSAFRYKNQEYYIWRNEEKVVINRAKGNVPKIYDLNKDSDKNMFYLDWVISLKDDTINDYVKYSSYVIYDLIMNYKKIMGV